VLWCSLSRIAATCIIKFFYNFIRPQSASPMPGESSHEQREHDLTMHVFSISAAMVGVCLTAIGILQLIATQTKVHTLGDDLLAMDAVLFVCCCFLSFWSFKARQARLRQRLRFLVDVLFMVALVVMVLICAIIAYALV
ncbi:MAG: hypothetical protein ACREUA_09905, partial [Burkholderiales bacterium]